jgi:tripartite-type tricarboxylate transporter receptor subunit TctC
MGLKSLSRIGLLALCVVAASAGSAAAQNYPERSVRIVIAFSAGGTIDTLGRIVAQKLSELWGQSVVIENRAGGGGNIGAIAAAQAAPDGYTLHFGAQSLAVNATLAPVASFDPVRDLEPIMLVATAQDVLIVPPSSPFKSLKELVDYAKANPRRLTYASLGSASSGHLAVAVFSQAAGVQLQQVSYTQPPQITADVIAGRIDVFLPTTGGHIGNVASGRVRALAVSGRNRAKQLPDVPTFEELGVHFEEETSWYALLAPKGTPKDIIAKINRDVERVLALPDVKEREAQLGFRMIGGPPEKLAAFLKHEIDKWAKVTKSPSFAGQ